MMWLLSAFKPNVPISIQAWLLLKHTRHTLGASLSTDVPKCLIGYHRYLRLLASHRLDPCEALNLGIMCSRQLHGNMGPCTTLQGLTLENPMKPLCKPKFLKYYSSLKRNFDKKCQFDNFVRHKLSVNHQTRAVLMYFTGS